MNRLSVAASFLWFCLGLQAQPKMLINQFEYIYSGSGAYEPGNNSPNYIQQRIIFALKDTLAQQIASSLIEGINGHWQVALDATNHALKVESNNAIFREFPKFKPKLQKNNPGGYELFLRIVDRGVNVPGLTPAEMNSLATRLMFECRILNSNDGSDVFSRKMDVNLYRTQPPEGAYPLLKIPGMPATFIAAFDSASRLFFSTSPPDLVNLPVVPACLFISHTLASTIRHTVKFEYAGSEIKLVNGPEIAWSPGQLEEQKVGKTKRKGAGIGSGIFTMITGLENEKEKTITKSYMTRTMMADAGTGAVYGFHIPVKEETSTTVTTYREKSSSGSSTIQTEESGGTHRRILQDGGFITRGEDTIGTFGISGSTNLLKQDDLLYYWDGRDSSTIMSMPQSWSSQGLYTLLNGSGMLYGKPFLFTNAKAGNQLDIWYNEAHVATFRMERGLPTDGLVYETDIPDEVLKVLAMFTSLPYGYYGFGH